MGSYCSGSIFGDPLGGLGKDFDTLNPKPQTPKPLNPKP